MGARVVYLVADSPRIVVHHLILVLDMICTPGAECASQSNLGICHNKFSLRTPVGFNIKDGKFNEIGDSGERVERRSPVSGRSNVARLKCGHVQQVNRVSNTSADGQWADIAQVARLLGRYTHEIVFTYRDNFDRVRVFEVGSAGVNVG